MNRSSRSRRRFRAIDCARIWYNVREWQRGNGMNTNISIENAFSDGWATFRNHMGSAIGAVLLALLVGSLTFGICIPPLMCGVFMLADNWLTKRNPNAGAGSVFDGFRLFLPSFCAALLMYIGLFVLGVVLLVVPVLGYLASLAVSLIGGALSV